MIDPTTSTGSLTAYLNTNKTAEEAGVFQAVLNEIRKAQADGINETGQGGNLLTVNDVELFNQRGISDEELKRYINILENFKNDPQALANPQEYLASLPSEDMNVLANAQSWGAMSRIDPATMSKEEAMNFILPDSSKVDLNNDGMIGTGNGGLSWRFPPPNASQEAKDAWAETTANMPTSDRLVMELRLMPLNLKVGPDGNVTHISPGSAEWDNPYASADVSYQDIIDEQIASLEFSRRFNKSENIDRWIGYLQDFSEALSTRGVA